MQSFRYAISTSLRLFQAYINILWFYVTHHTLSLWLGRVHRQGSQSIQSILWGRWWRGKSLRPTLRGPDCWTQSKHEQPPTESTKKTKKKQSEMNHCYSISVWKLIHPIKQSEDVHTCSFSILRQMANNSLGPLTLSWTAVLSSSSNLTVAAELKTIDTLSIMSCISSDERPNPGNVTSPATATIFFNCSGCSLRRFSNTYTTEAEDNGVDEKKKY